MALHASHNEFAGFRLVSVSCVALNCVRRVSEFFREIATFISRLGIVLLWTDGSNFFFYSFNDSFHFMPLNLFFSVVFQALSIHMNYEF